MLSLPVAAQAEAGDPVARMRGYHDGVIAAMKTGGGLAARVSAFEPLVRDYYDMPTIAALVVGAGWRDMPANARASVVKALTRHSAVSLARNFGTFGGERFTVSPTAVERGASTLVTVTVSSAGSQDTLIYRLRRGADGAWRIIDVVSGGVSQLALQRADLASTLAKGGASGLVHRLAEIDAVK
jgi:phospholipid transport system substrate-binding protein